MLWGRRTDNGHAAMLFAFAKAGLIFVVIHMVLIAVAAMLFRGFRFGPLGGNDCGATILLPGARRPVVGPIVRQQRSAPSPSSITMVFRETGVGNVFLPRR